MITAFQVLFYSDESFLPGQGDLDQQDFYFQTVEAATDFRNVRIIDYLVAALKEDKHNTFLDRHIEQDCPKGIISIWSYELEAQVITAQIKEIKILP